MKFIILASGSKGNSTLVVNGQNELLLIDVGIPYKEIKEKISKYGYSVGNIKNILVTHEHDDHIKSILSFSCAKKYSAADILNVDNKLEKCKETKIGNFMVMPIPLSHDVKCCGYVIKSDGETLVYITDTGYVNEKNDQYIKNANYYIFESNHDVQMLMETKRPSYIKSRIIGDEGHLNNEDASEKLCRIIGENTSQIFLAHISQEANTKEKAINTLIKKAEEENINMTNISIYAADQNVELVGGNTNEKVAINV